MDVGEDDEDDGVGADVDVWEGSGDEEGIGELLGEDVGKVEMGEGVACGKKGDAEASVGVDVGADVGVDKVGDAGIIVGVDVGDKVELGGKPLY